MAVAARRRDMVPMKTQQRVAADAGISLRHYQKIEAGAGDPRLTTLLKIAAALGVTLQALLEAASL